MPPADALRAAPRRKAGSWRVTRRIAAWWDSVSLVWQFVTVGVAVMLAGIVALGTWVSHTIEKGAAEAATASAAVYMNSLIAPHLADFGWTGELTPETRAVLDQVAKVAQEQRGVLAMKIWGRGGLVLYSNNHESEGKRFEPSDTLNDAWQGKVSWELDELTDPESAPERRMAVPLLEIYAPIRDATGTVVAVAEFYENARSLEDTLAGARIETWLVTGGSGLGLITAMLLIVARGSRTIEEQQRSLNMRVGQLQELLRQNEVLRADLQSSSRRASEENERLLNQLGTDLHDGPAQLISLALLRLKPSDLPRSDPRRRTLVLDVLKDALSDIRTVCSGLIMPEVRDMPAADAFRYIVDVHQRRTGTRVDGDIGTVPECLELFAKICLCRFIQEALTNAYRHAGGMGQKVRVWTEAGSIFASVEDAGPGFSDEQLADHSSSKFGLTGMRHRLRNLGGTLVIRSEPGKGTYLEARLPLTGDAA